MNLIEYEDLKENIEKVTRKIFDIYSSLAQLEILGKEKSKEYVELRNELKLFISMERQLNQKMLSEPEYLKKYYKMVADIPEYQIDVENYMLYGKSDSLYYSRVPRQLERTINFKDIQYERLLAVDRSLGEEPFLDKEREAFVRLKYYYIFVNPRAEDEFLSPSFMRDRTFKKDGLCSLYLLDSTENQLKYFHDAYKTYYQSDLLRKARTVIERWCMYPNYRFEQLDIMDMFLKNELHTLLLMMDIEQFDEVRGLAILVNDIMRACENNIGRRYAMMQIFSCIDDFEEDVKISEETEEVKKAKEKEYK